jgi:probable F420-dependent oxidoreductase
MKISVVTPLWQDRPALENMAVAENAERLAYPALWIGEMATFDAMSFATAVGCRDGAMALNVGPLAVSVRTPVNMAMGVASVAALTGRKVNLAIGTSSTVVVEGWHGRSRKQPARHLDQAAGVLNSLLAGEKVFAQGDLASCNGFRLRLDTACSGLTVAAFGDAAIKVAARHANRMLLNMVTSSSLARLKEQLRTAADEAGRAPPKLAVWLACAVDPGEETIQQILRAKVAYLAAPGYAEMFIDAGCADVVSLARDGAHPRELLEAIPVELAERVGLVGDEAAVRARIAEYAQAGADEICIVPATAGDPGGIRTLEALSGVARE